MKQLCSYRAVVQLCITLKEFEIDVRLRCA